jgi:hypothetical protein
LYHKIQNIEIGSPKKVHAFSSIPEKHSSNKKQVFHFAAFLLYHKGTVADAMQIKRKIV